MPCGGLANDFTIDKISSGTPLTIFHISFTSFELFTSFRWFSLCLYNFILLTHVRIETYEFRPGLTPMEPNNEMEFAPSGLADIFVLLGKAARDILDAINFYLNLRGSPFTEILDNVPLRNREISSSLLSIYCHARPSFQGAQHHNLTTQEDAQFQLPVPVDDFMQISHPTDQLFNRQSFPSFNFPAAQDGSMKINQP
ncbi:hypothetical protein LOK49_LG11G00259 [Camellia lanceoleosa]|uniref:Uncharacterized protein n=1 Tax=Camellia lanceoleosa TaxID=1840588 RepID=A0ACC0G307_9ERIC|nr:hypothetical protein LOK49_LG11G00259 [Camellia lanceoleosa]